MAFSFALIGLGDLCIGFGGLCLPETISLQIEHVQRICWLGRKGARNFALAKEFKGDLRSDRGEA